MHASTFTRFSRPPKAAMICSALLSVATEAGAVNTSVAVPDPPTVDGRGGVGTGAEIRRLLGLEFVLRLPARVRMFHFLIAKRNNR